MIKRGGEKSKPTKLINLNHQKYKLLLKRENKEKVVMVGKQEELF